jgi:hypothetical protein
LSRRIFGAFESLPPGSSTRTGSATVNVIAVQEKPPDLLRPKAAQRPLGAFNPLWEKGIIRGAVKRYGKQ